MRMLSGIVLAAALLASPVLAADCVLTTDAAVQILTENGMKSRVTDDPAEIAEYVDRIKGEFGIDETGAVKVLIGTAGNHVKVGFEDVDGCMSPAPYVIDVNTGPKVSA